MCTHTHTHTHTHTYTQANKIPLHYACHWGSVDLVEPLLNRDSTAEFINAQDSNGDTALHIACRRGHKEAIKLLVTKGAVKDIKNQVCEWGLTPCSLVLCFYGAHLPHEQCTCDVQYIVC